MNILVISAASRVGIHPDAAMSDSFAMLLFIAGAVSLAIAGYLLYKAPKAHPARYVRRH